jgi:hypothetical protein
MEANYRIDESTTNGDLEKSVALLKRLYKSTRYYAIVKETVDSGILKVDIARLGLKDAICYVTWAESLETYEKDARILVSVDQETGTAFILPPELPRTPGKYKVVQNIDDSDPPTLDQDWTRFRGALFGG